MTLGKFRLGDIISLNDLVEKILRYSNYFLASGGGVTLSGGEPLLQQDFVLSLLKELKKFNISVAIDTSGNFKLTDKLKEIIYLTDLFLLDIKHICPNKCKDLVGFSNELELDFARFLSDNNKPMWIRQVIIPGITDDENDLLKLKGFLSTLKTVEKVELLKYHNMGKFKWEDLHIPYELENVRPATDDDIVRAKKILGIS